jgi:hypothetical protein
MTSGDDRRRDRDRIAELNQIHSLLRWWSSDEIVALVADDRELAKALWRDDEARRTLLAALVELDPVAASELHARLDDEHWGDRAGFGARLRRSLDRLARRRP